AQPTPGAKQYPKYPDMTIDPAKEYIATIVTEKGDIKIKLFPKAAPKTVNSFVFLARDGFYNGITFHRVIPNFMAQTGDPTAQGTGGPGYEYENEYDATLGVTFDREGIVGMANAGPNTNGSQFFITNAPTSLNAQEYTVFGEVIEGIDVVKAIDARDPQFGATVPGDQLFTITIEEK
ncbi:MAG TPA: peptidylprolyl isomerase, partial [Herpetosiphonaceae bacterium]